METNTPPPRSRLSRLDPGYWVAALLPLVGLLPTFGDGIARTADGPLHVQRMYAMTTLLQQGNLWPRWVPWFHLGYGYPIFNFYPPGVFYLGGIFGALGLPIPLAFNLVAALAWVLGSVGAYALARTFLPSVGALLAAMLWSYAPSRLFEVWDQGSLPQMMAAALVPWVLWGLARVSQRPTRRHVLAVALPFAGMILSHQPITLISGLFIAPAALLLPFSMCRKGAGGRGSSSPSLCVLGVSVVQASSPSLLRWGGGRGVGTSPPSPPVERGPEGEVLRAGGGVLQRIAGTLGGLLLGLGLAAIFLIPLAAELRYVKANQQAEDVIAYLTSNFLQPWELFIQPLPMDMTDLRFELPTTLGLVGGLFATLGLAALVIRRRYRVALALAVALAFALFMLLEISLPVWQVNAFMTQLRFPERFLRLAALFLALAGGASLLLLPERWRMAGLAVALPVVLVAVLPMAYPGQPFVNWPTLSPTDEIDMEKTQYIWGSTSYDEFKPIWVGSPAFDTSMAYEEYRADPMLIIVNQLDQIRQWPDLQVEPLGGATHRITLTDARPVRFRQFYFPGWTATLDGAPVAIRPDAANGEITIDMPPGQHTVTLTYTGTTAQAVGALVTLVSIGLTIFLALSHFPSTWLIKQGAYLPASSPSSGLGFSVAGCFNVQRLNPRPALLIAAATVAFALLNALFIASRTTWFRYQSPPDAPVKLQTPVGQSFGGAFELLGYTLEQTSAARGGLLNLTLFWRAERATDQEYRPVVQLVNLPVSGAWAVSEPFFPGGGKTDQGYPLDRFASEVHELRLFDDAPPYVGRLSVQMLDARSGEPLPLPDGADRLLLDPLIRIAGNNAPLPQRLNVRFDDVVELQCAVIQSRENNLTVELGWRVLQTPTADFNIFLHSLDTSGQKVEQHDGLPLGAEYPPTLWLPGQNLVGRYTLPANPAAVSLALGLYTPDRRLTATQDNAPLVDNRLLLPFSEESC